MSQSKPGVKSNGSEHLSQLMFHKNTKEQNGVRWGGVGVGRNSTVQRRSCVGASGQTVEKKARRTTLSLHLERFQILPTGFHS